MIAIVTAISLILQVNSGNVYPRIEVTDQLTPRLTIRQSALSELPRLGRGPAGEDDY
jgi:hypothetical protein